MDETGFVSDPIALSLSLQRQSSVLDRDNRYVFRYASGDRLRHQRTRTGMQTNVLQREP